MEYEASGLNALNAGDFGTELEQMMIRLLNRKEVGMLSCTLVVYVTCLCRSRRTVRIEANRGSVTRQGRFAIFNQDRVTLAIFPQHHEQAECGEVRIWHHGFHFMLLQSFYDYTALAISAISKTEKPETLSGDDHLHEMTEHKLLAFQRSRRAVVAIRRSGGGVGGFGKN